MIAPLLRNLCSLLDLPRQGTADKLVSLEAIPTHCGGYRRRSEARHPLVFLGVAPEPPSNGVLLGAGARASCSAQPHDHPRRGGETRGVFGIAEVARCIERLAGTKFSAGTSSGGGFSGDIAGPWYRSVPETMLMPNRAREPGVVLHSAPGCVAERLLAESRFGWLHFSATDGFPRGSGGAGEAAWSCGARQ